MLGAVLSLAEAEAGAKVVLVGRDADRAAARAAAIRAVGGAALVVLADVLDGAQLAAARTTIVHTWGRIDGLVNAAGGNIPGATIGPDQDLVDFDTEDTHCIVVKTVGHADLCVSQVRKNGSLTGFGHLCFEARPQALGLRIIVAATAAALRAHGLVVME